MSPGTRTSEKTKTASADTRAGVLDVSQLPEELGPDFGVYIKPEYVRARVHEDGEGYDVVSGNGDERVLTPLAADVFDSQYAVVAPNKVLNYAWVPK